MTLPCAPVSGTVCTKINDYYSQCLPGAATPPPTSTVPVTTPPGSSSTPTGSAPPGLSSIPASTLHQITGFGTNPNNVAMYVYKPARVAANPPLIMAIHCTSPKYHSCISSRRQTANGIHRLLGYCAGILHRLQVCPARRDVWLRCPLPIFCEAVSAC